MAGPVIVYVPGLLPKPAPEAHRQALLRCILTGVGRIDAAVASALESRPDSFELVAWTWDFYGEHRDIGLDREAIEAVLTQTAASDTDIAEASAWSRHLTRWIYALGDRLPFLIPHLASERMELHLRDLRRYRRNPDGVTDRVKQRLKSVLQDAAGQGRPVLLIGHSMGSVIAYDSLWELTHEQGDPLKVDLFLSMGSPLGQRYMQRRIRGHNESGSKRYPQNIRRWKNLSAVGDLTAIDPRLVNDFGEMIELGLTDAIDDDELYNYFRLDGKLNVHAEYGYLVNEKTAHTIVTWWRGLDAL